MPYGPQSTDKNATVVIHSMILGPVDMPFTSVLTDVPIRADKAPLIAAMMSTLSYLLLHCMPITPGVISILLIKTTPTAFKPAAINSMVIIIIKTDIIFFLMPKVSA